MNNLLLTGNSGVGKSTLIKRAAEALSGRRIAGFVSESIWVDGQRTGWTLKNLKGEGGLYIHGSLKSQHSLGGLGVDLSLLDRLCESELKADAEIYLIDEIGRTGAWSPLFMQLVTQLLDSDKKIIAAIHKSLDGPVGAIRARQDAELWEVTLENRDLLLSKIILAVGYS